jgi:hypothetical protein
VTGATSPPVISKNIHTSLDIAISPMATSYWRLEHVRADEFVDQPVGLLLG